MLHDPRDHGGLRRIFAGAETSFPHMMRHSDNRGFYVPGDYERPELGSESEWWKVGATQRLLEELQRLLPMIQTHAPALSDAHERLLAAATVACAEDLPIILDA